MTMLDHRLDVQHTRQTPVFRLQSLISSAELTGSPGDTDVAR